MLQAEIGSAKVTAVDSFPTRGHLMPDFTLSSQAVPTAALYITDRFLEVFAVWRNGTGDRLPDISQVLSWLTYLASQCPECTQIEWPIDD